jgi:prophage regulatory protein
MRLGYSRSTVYLRVSQGLLPRPVKIGPRASAWPAHEIDTINTALIAGKTDQEIRLLVANIEAARKEAI